MLVQRHMHLEVEIIKWLALLAMASALAVAISSTAGGADIKKRTGPPRLLPSTATEAVRPMENEQVEPIPLYQPADLPIDTVDDLARQLWIILDHHRNGNPEPAKAAWEYVQLPSEAEVWRYLALGLAQLQTSELDAAGESWDVAMGLDPDNPLPHYYLAIYRLTQARQALDWYDATGPRSTVTVAFRPPDVVPNSKSMYELAAATEFERAIELADNVRLEDSLLPLPDSRSDPSAAKLRVTPPTVGDLLVALGADNFAGKAHHALGGLYLDHGLLDAAEMHLDQAAASGVAVIYGYSDLGACYTAEGRHADAFRAHLKALGRGDGCIRPARRALDSLGKAVGEIL